MTRLIFSILVSLLPVWAFAGGPGMLFNSGSGGAELTDRVVSTAEFYANIINADQYDTQTSIVIYNSSNSEIGHSSPTVIGSGLSWRIHTYESGPTLTQGSTIRIAIAGAYYFNVNTNSTTSACSWVYGDYPTSVPATIAPGTDDIAAIGQIGIVLKNAAGQVLAGNSNVTGYTTSTGLSAYNGVLYLTSGYVVN